MTIQHLDPRDPPPRWVLGPPDEPPLELAAVRPIERWKEALLETLYFAVVLLVGSFLVLWGDGLARWIGVLPFLTVFLGVIYVWRWWASDVPGWIVAGARWVATGTGRPQRRPRYAASIYRISRVEVTPTTDVNGNPLGTPLQVRLYLDSTPGKAAFLDKALVEANPALWALVYNGIRHSVARGARIDAGTRDVLHLDPI